VVIICFLGFLRLSCDVEDEEQHFSCFFLMFYNLMAMVFFILIYVFIGSISDFSNRAYAFYIIMHVDGIRPTYF